MPEQRIFKILHRDEWQKAQQDGGVFNGSGIDLTDGYIHFSTAHQAVETAARYFAGQQDLLLVAVDANQDHLLPNVKWEAARGGQLFAHLYGALDCKSVLWAKELPLDADGQHIFPDMEQ
jgi:uncharacterized protein (DUF952 family)